MTVRQAVARSPLARVAALPGRVRLAAAHDGRTLRQTGRWLLRSREHTNFTYHLTPLNLEHLCWFVAQVTGSPIDAVRELVHEAASDAELSEHVRERVAGSARRWLADDEVRLGRRLGWYAIVRLLRPAHVVESGTDKGLGSVVFAAALERNGAGSLTTIDVNADSGYLLAGRFAHRVDRRIGDSLVVLRDLTSVDVFLHDSLHTHEHEAAELAAVTPSLSARALVLSDNAHSTSALAEWAEATGRSFLFFAEQPADHWYRGGGIGAAWFPDARHSAA